MLTYLQVKELVDQGNQLITLTDQEDDHVFATSIYVPTHLMVRGGVDLSVYLKVEYLQAYMFVTHMLLQYRFEKAGL